jgi:hypothetical protein
MSEVLLLGITKCPFPRPQKRRDEMGTYRTQPRYEESVCLQGWLTSNDNFVNHVNFHCLFNESYIIMVN